MQPTTTCAVYIQMSETGSSDRLMSQNISWHFGPYLSLIFYLQRIQIYQSQKAESTRQCWTKDIRDITQISLGRKRLTWKDELRKVNEMDETRSSHRWDDKEVIFYPITLRFSFYFHHAFCLSDTSNPSSSHHTSSITKYRTHCEAVHCTNFPFMPFSSHYVQILSSELFYRQSRERTVLSIKLMKHFFKLKRHESVSLSVQNNKFPKPFFDNGFLIFAQNFLLRWCILNDVTAKWYWRGYDEISYCLGWGGGGGLFWVC